MDWFNEWYKLAKDKLVRTNKNQIEFTFLNRFQKNIQPRLFGFNIYFLLKIPKGIFSKVWGKINILITVLL